MPFIDSFRRKDFIFVDNIVVSKEKKIQGLDLASIYFLDASCRVGETHNILSMKEMFNCCQVDCLHCAKGYCLIVHHVNYKDPQRD